MAEDLNATRRIKPVADPVGPGPAGAVSSGGSRREDLSRDLAGRDLAARSVRYAQEHDDLPEGLRPVQRWVSQASSVPDIERELSKIWGSGSLRATGDGANHVAARSSVLNLVVVAEREGTAEHCAATIARMAGRHPSRSLILSAEDVEGPPSLEAQIEAHCILPTSGTAETCAEMIYIRTGGETSRHLAAIIVPLLVHDLPVALWWPYDPALRSHRADRLLPLTDRLIVDGSSWSDSGLDRLVDLAYISSSAGIAVADFALLRQARWREALASVYDRPDLRSHLRSIRSITVDYAAPEGGDGSADTNVVKPVYHVAWLASRLGMSVVEPLARDADGQRRATLRQGRGTVRVALRPVASAMPLGTTLRVEIVSRRGGEELVGDVTAEQETVDVTIRERGRDRLTRSYLAPRQKEVDLLAVAVEETAPDAMAVDTLAMASWLVTAEPTRRRRRTAAGGRPSGTDHRARGGRVSKNRTKPAAAASNGQAAKGGES